MGSLSSEAILAVLALGAVLSALAAPGLLILQLRRWRRAAQRFKEEADDLHDHVWELREAAAARDRAEAANEAKSRFLASVSHEVRTPLNGILGMAELLAGTGLSAEQATYVAAIRSSGSALASLIDEILDFSKIEAGRIAIASESFDLVALVEGITELLAPRAQGKGLEIASTLDADVPRQVIGDPVRLRQILLNLAGNAVKFTERGGVGLRVRVDAAAGAHLSFDVLDTGPGVPAERRAVIFDEFEQADSSTTRRHGGTGLGLAIARRLAEQMGGTVTLVASPDGAPPGAAGAQFTVTLPLPADPAARRAAPEADLGGTSVLVAAASPFEAPFLAARLQEAGSTVSQAASEAEALEALQRTAFDFVVVDCALGEEATRTIGEAARAARAGQTLVLLSPFERRAFGQVSAAGFDGWLIKPVRKESLFRRFGSDAPAPPPALVPPAGAAIAGAFEVLLAEDNEINALLATRHLERLGATVTRAPDGLTALALIEAAMDAGAPYDVVILDIRMPGLDGFEVARRVRLAESARRLGPTRLIACSADARDAERRSATLAGIDLFIGKPVSFARLEQALAPDLTSAA